MKLYDGVWGGTMKNWLKFGCDPGLFKWVNEQKSTAILFGACPDRGAGNDPEALESAIHQSPTFMNA